MYVNVTRLNRIESAVTLLERVFPKVNESHDNWRLADELCGLVLSIIDDDESADRSLDQNLVNVMHCKAFVLTVREAMGLLQKRKCDDAEVAG